MLAVTSPGFVVFAALLAWLWYACPPARRWQLMLAASAVFYVTQDPRGYLVLLAAALLVWLCALRVQQGRGWLFAGLAAALVPLALIKYLPALQGSTDHWQTLGIGYFTMQLISYLLDVRRGTIPPERSFGRVLCYASCFLCVTQGPLARYDELMPDLSRPIERDATRILRGAQRSAWGYFKKYAIADRCQPVVDAVFADPTAFDRTQLLFGAVLYTVQLFADFSAYTDIVLGVGEMLGLTLPENFRQPFFATSIKDLWARWHISLSRWLRDYIYFPLGGSRCSAARRDANLIVTFLVSGLWHGAGATYLVWGGLHGVSQAVQSHLPKHPKGQKLRLRPLRSLGAFAWLAFAFVIFRATSLQNAWQIFRGIVCNPGHRLLSNYWELGLTSRQEQLTLFLGIAVLLLVEALHERGVSLRDRVGVLPVPARWAVYELSLLAFLFMGRFLGGGAFLYAKY